MERKLAAILYADVAGYSRLIGADEEGTHRIFRAHFDALNAIIEGHGGRIVHTAGDALLAEFSSIVTAVNCAMAAQRDLAKRNENLTDSRKLQFRIGVNLGDIMIDGEEIYGDGVNIAARLEALAEPGGICVSGSVFDQVEDKLGVAFQTLGPQSVKNIGKPVRAYRIDLAAPVPAKPRPEAENEQPDLRNTPSIAVLPFENLSGDPEQEHLADGMTENIIAALSQIPELFVIAHHSVFTYKGNPVRVQQVAEEQGVRYVLEGSIQREGDRLRITAQLIDAVDGHHMWTERFDRKGTDVFDIEDEIALKIVVALEVNLTVGEQARLLSGSTRSLQAWSYYKEGLSHYEKYVRDGNCLARELGQKAAAVDPRFVEAWNLVGWTHVTDARLGYSESPERSLELADEMADKVASLAPESPQWHQLRSFIHMLRGDFDAAIREGYRAIELIPAGAVHRATLAVILHFAGRHEEAIAMLQEAMHLNPVFPSWYVLYLSRAYTYAGQYEKAIDAARQGQSRAEGTFMEAGHLIDMALAQVARDNIDDAREEVELAQNLAPYLSLTLFRAFMHFKDPADWEFFADALRKAGMPE